MRAPVEIHDLVADLLQYPLPHQAAKVAATAEAVAIEMPALREALGRIVALARGGSTGELEEAYAAAFDNNADCALEIGWHSFGENYTRGAFLVRMRERLRECAVPETTELPDHVSHVLRVLARIDEHQAAVLSEAIVLPAIGKILAALPASSVWRGPVEAAALVLRTHAGVQEPTHA